MAHPVAQEVSPRLQFGLKESFGMQQQGGRSRICIHGPKEINQRERREFSKAPLHLEIIFSFQKLSLNLYF